MSNPASRATRDHVGLENVVVDMIKRIVLDENDGVVEGLSARWHQVTDITMFASMDHLVLPRRLIRKVLEQLQEHGRTKAIASNWLVWFTLQLVFCYKTLIVEDQKESQRLQQRSLLDLVLFFHRPTVHFGL